MSKVVFAFILTIIGSFSLGSFLGVNGVPFTLINFLWFNTSCIILVVGFIKLYNNIIKIL